MALLTLASVGAGIWLALSGSAGVAAIGLLLLFCGLGLAWIMEGLLVPLEDLALAAQQRWGSLPGGALALLCGGLPTALVMLWVYGCFQWLSLGEVAADPLAKWLFFYGIATGPWTLFALHVGNDRRTVCGVRAYAAGLAYWLLSISLLIMPQSADLAVAALLVPAALPWTTGTVLALADRAMLRTVRI